MLLHHSYMEVVGKTLKREDAISPRYIAKTITQILLFYGSFLRSHVQNKRKRFMISYEIDCKDTNIFRHGENYFTLSKDKGNNAEGFTLI